MAAILHYVCVCGNNNKDCFDIRLCEESVASQFAECALCHYPLRELSSPAALLDVLLHECPICEQQTFEERDFYSSDNLQLICLQCDGCVPLSAVDHWLTEQSRQLNAELDVDKEAFRKFERCSNCNLKNGFSFYLLESGTVVVRCSGCQFEMVVCDEAKDHRTEDRCVASAPTAGAAATTDSVLLPLLCSCGASFESYHFHGSTPIGSQLLCSKCSEVRFVKDFKALRHHVRGVFSSGKPGGPRGTPRKVTSINDLSPGQHVMFPRSLGYQHHGVVVSVALDAKEYTLVHFNNYTEQMERLETSKGDASKHDLVFRKGTKGVVQIDTRVLEIGKEPTYILDYYPLDSFTPGRVVERALCAIGRDDYHLLYSNCEHFACWCKTDVSRSQQVENVFDWIIETCSLVLPILARQLRVFIKKHFGSTAGYLVTFAADAIISVGMFLQREYKRLQSGEIEEFHWHRLLMHCGKAIVNAAGK